MKPVSLLVLVFALPASAAAFQVDLVPGSARPEAVDIVGSVSIAADGGVRVSIENVNDAAGDSLDGTITVQMKMRVNGVKRRFVLPMVVESGDGEIESTLGVVPGDRVAVLDLRVRGPAHRTIAQAGLAAEAVAPPPPPPPPPPPDQCPAALVECQDDLALCTEDLNDCEEPL
jgi:hypothetical protein